MDDDSDMGPCMRALSEQRRRFVRAMAANPFSPQREWALAAGYSDVDGGARCRASYLLTHPKIKAAVREVAEATLGAAGPMKAVQALLDVVSSPTDGGRIKAAEAILNRVGMSEKQQIEVVHRDLTGDALMERIKMLAEKHGVSLGTALGEQPKVIEHRKDE